MKRYHNQLDNFSAVLGNYDERRLLPNSDVHVPPDAMLNLSVAGAGFHKL